MTYSMTYASTDLGAIVIDILGGFLSVLATAASPIVWIAVALLLVGGISGLLFVLSRMGR
jgi:hypothetical protein